MQSSSIIALVGLAIANAAAQTTTTSSLPTALPALVSNIPSCALSCLDEIKVAIGCNVGDLKCLCETDGELIAKMSICNLTSECSRDQIGQTNNVLDTMCKSVRGSADTAALASASNVMTGAVGKATATASAKPTATNAANPLGQGLEMALIAAAAAIAL
ncbi:hypothetical protein CkaCkLH20_05420 [Colletotrichum karsti]|uniref:CFEM domain-containing protein n=1 Tax=Colletotrichum karsti TaxID=1095194 RepID=A0A9P6LIB8_9PEZI|nr:uncharacterized protein CkaCkLH20_05420 [Colletotrichum karsti]KAF9877154.1 hypothetical protein CkaCkLH20_05420 [Colletotrichum karsti]